ncbi:uncharacterized protein G6M90_00g074740 [Metarhizium brunneum]|uniref:Up-regulated during septation protein 1 domain-containing protein n=1 Tax=Metarhizium brunneum TaxID=500148 RepID=A0A7D5Z3D7_9HYPO|nr:hypothetical protein G6M90_00g074740 [Metarhizium brunneum]
MAHIATCIANIEPGSVPKSPSPTLPILSTTPPTSSIDKSFAWRMLPTEQRKYQLFPKDKPIANLNISKSLDPEAAFAVAMSDRNDKGSAGSALRLRVNQYNPLRRRKVSVPELEPMTTVQEIAMDSPTIPGRPPLHERSSSAPEDARDERQRVPMRSQDTSLPVDITKVVNGTLPQPALQTPLSQSLPHRLAPLLIPKAELPAPLLQSKVSSNNLRSDSTPPSSSRSARLDYSPLGRPRITPSISTPDLSQPKSASSDCSSATTLPTPISAPIMESHRASPKPWDGSSIFSSQSDRSVSGQDGPKKSHIHQHRRGASESSTTGMMDRGRPRKRTEVRNTNGSSLKSNDSKKTLSCERRAFEELPKGWKPSDAAHKLSFNDVVALQKQALDQAERFEVLRVEDVDALSKELRSLDERTDYLRRTYTSLRAGRRNLHSRICQYLRSPRVAKFSHESMLKQEEALAELDASIDDWVAKLERAENRRTRVRQKLLEHVAAAALLPVAKSTPGLSESVQSVKSPGGPRELSTPPRSPSKTSFASRTDSASPSPQRVVAQVPSTIIEQPVVEDAAKNVCDISRAGSTVTLKRSDVQSIRIYAGDDVYALLADVENQISKMGVATPESTASLDIQSQRQRSREQLIGRVDYPSPPHPAGVASATAAILAPNAADINNRDGKNATPSPISSQAKDGATEGEILLTAAVFKPESAAKH